MSNARHRRSTATQETRATGLLLRVVWMMLAPVLLFVLGARILIGEGLSALDALYAGLLVVAIAARYVDVARFHGQTAEGEPATMEDARGYSIKLSLAAVGAWALAHLSSGW